MNQFGTVTKELASYLERWFSTEDVKVVEEFPLGRKPMRRRCLAVGLGGVELPAALGDSGQVKLTLRFDILCPTGTAGGCHAVFNRLCDALVCGEGGFRVQGISCGELRYDNALAALTLTAQSTLTGILLAAEDEGGAPMTAVVIQTREG